MIWLFPYHILYQPLTNIIPRAKALGLIQDVIRKEPYNILYIIHTKKLFYKDWLELYIGNLKDIDNFI